MRTSVIMPTMGRPMQAVRCIERLVETTAGHDVEVIVVVEVDEAGANTIRQFSGATVHFRAEHRGPVYGWNEGALLATGDALFLGADDLQWGDGWLDAMLEAMHSREPAFGFVGANDGHRDAEKEMATHYLATREHLARVQNGCFALPVYKHYGFDWEMSIRAREAGDFVWARAAMVTHMHPQWKTAEWDETYTKAWPHRKIDTALFYERQAAGWPDNFKPILKAVAT